MKGSIILIKKFSNFSKKIMSSKNQNNSDIENLFEQISTLDSNCEKSTNFEFIPLTSSNYCNILQYKIDLNFTREKRRKEILTPIKKKRRLAANERERRRMHNLNEAFDKLRQHLPSAEGNRQLSKYETLQIAQTYITALCELLE